MQLKTLLNRVHPLKGFVYGEAEFRGSKRQALYIRVRPDARRRPLCSGCKKPRAGYDSLEERRFEFVPVWGLLVYLLYAMRRVDCPDCGVKVESVPWSTGKSSLTLAYAYFLAAWAKRMSWMEVARAFHTSWESVFRSVELVVKWGLAHRSLDGITALGVDEVLWRRGYKFLTVVYQIDGNCRRLLWVGRDRTVKTLLRFFRVLGKKRAAALQYVCSDMWKPYLKVLAKKASGAIHILDRFHLMAKMNKAIDEVRAKEARELKGKGQGQILKHARWTLLKRPENLTAKQGLKLAELVRHNLRAVRSYLLKEEFQLFWTYRSPAWAAAFLDSWCMKTMRSRIEPMKKVARTLRAHRPLILNWFRAKGAFSSGVVEGLNNRLKVVTRRSYGFRSYRVVEIALYHSLGRLPEPMDQLPHRFC